MYIFEKSKNYVNEKNTRDIVLSFSLEEKFSARYISICMSLTIVRNLSQTDTLFFLHLPLRSVTSPWVAKCALVTEDDKRRPSRY